jgi:hypothetical protein
MPSTVATAVTNSPTEYMDSAGDVGAEAELGTIGLLLPFPQLASAIATAITPSHLSNALRSTERRS